MKVDTKFAKAGFMTMPMWAKGLIGVAVVGTIIYVAYKVIKAPSKLKETQGARQEDVMINNEYQQLINKGVKPQMSKAQLMGIANKLDTAMQNTGSDTMAIYTAIKSIPTYVDLLGVIQAFGTRTMKGGNWFNSDFTGSLGMCLNNELSADRGEMELVNKILASKKINYKF